MSSDDYAPIRIIGKGAFGTAHIVQHKASGERCVLKRVRLARQSAKERQCSVRELLLLSNLQHRNVLQFKGCWVEGGCNLCLLVELCESGDLFTQLRFRAPSGTHFSEQHLKEMAVQLLTALAYLHRSNIVHRDLKTANILVTAEGCLKIADFGLSTMLEAGKLTRTMVGTPNYMSGEVLQGKPYGTPNDVWGLGCVLFELSALKPAFQAFNMEGLVKKVTSAPAPQLPACYSEQWRSFVRSMLSKEPEARPTAEQLLEMEWLQPAVRRVAAKFGAELPPAAPAMLERLAELPADIMALMDNFQAQEKEERRRAEHVREQRMAAAAKWDPIARAAAMAKQTKLPPLKPHQARKPPPKQPRAGPGGAAPPPAGGLPLVPPAGRGSSGSPASSAAARPAPFPRRKTYCGGGDNRRAAPGGPAGGGRTHSQQPPRAAGASEAGPAGAVRSSASESSRLPPSAPWARPALGESPPMGSIRLQGLNRPSSAPPDSPMRRTRGGPPRGGGPSVGSCEGDSDVFGRADADDDAFAAPSSAGDPPGGWALSSGEHGGEEHGDDDTPDRAGAVEGGSGSDQERLRSVDQLRAEGQAADVGGRLFIKSRDVQRDGVCDAGSEATRGEPQDGPGATQQHHNGGPIATSAAAVPAGVAPVATTALAGDASTASPAPPPTAASEAASAARPSPPPPSAAMPTARPPPSPPSAAVPTVRPPPSAPSAAMPTARPPPALAAAKPPRSPPEQRP